MPSAACVPVRANVFSHRPHRLSAAITLALGTWIVASPAAAADLTWNGQLNPPLWSASVFGLSNWNDGLRPQDGDKLTFSGNLGLTSDNDNIGLLVRGITFAAGAGGFTLRGSDANRLALAGNLTNNSNVVQTINMPIDARNTLSQVWDGGAQGMVINGPVTLSNGLTLNLVNKTSIHDPGTFIVGAGGTDSVLVVQSESKVTSNGGSIGASSSVANVTVSGTGSSWTSGSLVVGDQGRGSLRIEAGGNVASSYGLVGFRPGAVGAVTVIGANSQWTMSDNLIVGEGGAGTLLIANGGLVSNGAGRIGTERFSTVTVDGSNSRWINNGSLFIASRGQGNLTIENGGFVSSAGGTIGGVGSLSVDQPGNVTVTGAGSAWINAGALDVGSSGTGRLAVQSGAMVAAGALSVGNTGVLDLDGGTLQIHDGRVTGAGQFNWLAGTLRIIAAGSTLGVGALQLDSATTLPASRVLEFSDSFSVGSGNQLTLAGGTLGGAGTLLNDGFMGGAGTVAGSGGFRNSGLITQYGGNLVLSNTGANANTGNWDLPSGFQLELAGATLTNRGALNLNGAVVGGTGTLVNAAGGTVSGRGNITATFSNAGALALDSGATSISQAFANSGQIQLASNTATLSGGVVGNSGQIEGRGRVNNAVNNTGTLEAIGGTLTFAGALTNTGSGAIVAGTGAKVLVSSGLASNAAQIQLAGGTFDNNGAALANIVTGAITGFGTLRGGALANDGKLLLAGGTSAVHMDLRSAANSQIILSGNGNTTFYGPVEIQGGAELRVSQGSVATFFGQVFQRSGARFTGTGAKYYEGGLSLGNSPGLGTDGGSVTFGDSNTYTAEIAGTQAGDALGNGIQFDRYVVAGALTFGGTLQVVALNGFAPQAGQSFDLFDWGSTQGSFEVLNFAQAPLAGGLAWDTSRLYIDGSLSVAAVPEPASIAMLLAGLGCVGLVARRRRRLPMGTAAAGVDRNFH